MATDKKRPTGVVGQRDIGCRRLSALLSIVVGAKDTHLVSYSSLCESLASETRSERVSRTDIKAYVLGAVWPQANTICRISAALQENGVNWATEPLFLHQSGRLQEFLELLIIFLLEPLMGDAERPRMEDVECLAILMTALPRIQIVTALDHDPVIIDVCSRGLRNKSQNDHIIRAFADINREHSQIPGPRERFESRERARALLHFDQSTRKRFSSAWAMRNKMGRLNVYPLPVLEELERALAMAQDTFKSYQRREWDIQALLEEAFLGELRLAGRESAIRRIQRELESRPFRIRFTRRIRKRLAGAPHMNLLPPDQQPSNQRLIDWGREKPTQPDDLVE